MATGGETAVYMVRAKETGWHTRSDDTQRDSERGGTQLPKQLSHPGLSALYVPWRRRHAGAVMERWHTSANSREIIYDIYMEKKGLFC